MRWSRRTGSATRGDVGADGTRSVDDQVGVLVPHVKRGGTSYPRKGAGWALEISLDVQWAHAIAPGAKILLVEAASNSFANLLAAEDYAKTRAQYVSSSGGGCCSSYETANATQASVATTRTSAAAGSGALRTSRSTPTRHRASRSTTASATKVRAGGSRSGGQARRPRCGGSFGRRGRGRGRVVGLRRLDRVPRHHRRQQRRAVPGRLRPVHRARPLARLSACGGGAVPAALPPPH